MTWVQEFAHGAESIANLDAVPWFEAPLPRRWHRCTSQTTGFVRDFTVVDRCPCGAIRLDGPGHPWMQKNSRRKK